MKRVNVHLSETILLGLDQILKKINEGSYWRNHSRADLIRYAIGKTFDIKAGYFGSLEEDLKKTCKKKK